MGLVITPPVMYQFQQFTADNANLARKHNLGISFSDFLRLIPLRLVVLRSGNRKAVQCADRPTADGVAADWERLSAARKR